MERSSSYVARLYWRNPSLGLLGDSGPLFKDFQLLLRDFKLGSTSRSISSGTQDSLFFSFKLLVFAGKFEDRSPGQQQEQHERADQARIMRTTDDRPVGLNCILTRDCVIGLKKLGGQLTLEVLCF